MNRPSTTTTLLALVAVLLGVNLLPMADAGENGPSAPHIVKLIPLSHWTFHRVWSDGRVDTMQRTDGNCDYESNLTHGPVQHLFPVVDAVLGASLSASLMLTYSDGRVDLIGGGDRCTIAGIGTPSLCIGDIDRDGIVGIEDFLIVLGQWDCQ